MSETKSKGGRTSEYAGKVFAVIAAKEAIKGYKSKSPAVEAAVKAILAVKNSTKVAAAIKAGTSVADALVLDVKKAPKLDALLGTLVGETKINTAHIRRAIAENLIHVV
jgi:hypothetical protein